MKSVEGWLLVRLAQQRCQDLQPDMPTYPLGDGQRKAFETGFEQGIEQMCTLLDNLLMEIAQA